MAQSDSHFRAADFKRDDLRSLYQLSLRYPGQNFALTVDVKEAKGARDLSFVDESMREAVIDRFHSAHEREYGHRREGEEPEITSVRLETSAAITQLEFRSGFTAARREARPLKKRRVNLGQGFQETHVYDGPHLEPGDRVNAPGIIEETFTTIVVYPGWQALIDDAGDYVLTPRSS